MRDRHPAVRAALLLGGFVGPLLPLVSLGTRFGLGFDALWYLAELTAVGYVPIVALVIVLGWAAGAAQVVALSIDRYAPYPRASERPPRGPIRNAVRAVVLGTRSQRRSVREAEAQEA